MSKFTTEVRWICESFVPELNWQGEYEHSGYGDVEKALQAGYEHIFDFDFPIWKESYREHLCKLILLHYYFETKITVSRQNQVKSDKTFTLEFVFIEYTAVFL